MPSDDLGRRSSYLYAALEVAPEMLVASGPSCHDKRDRPSAGRALSSIHNFTYLDEKCLGSTWCAQFLTRSNTCAAPSVARSIAPGAPTRALSSMSDTS